MHLAQRQLFYSPPTSPIAPSLNRPPARTTPSGGSIQSIAERMANLRASGAAGATSLQSTNRSSPRAPSPTSQTSASIRTHAPEAFSVHSPPPKPLKPAGLSTGRTPPQSPRGTGGDLVEDSAVQRSGSAPPIVPHTEVSNDPSLRDKETAIAHGGGLSTNGFIDRGPAGGVETAPESRAPHSENDELPTPSRFPSLDDFERTVTGSPKSKSDYPFPSVPSSDPPLASTSSSASTSTRAPPPHPPKPPFLDKATFEREQRERAEKMAQLSAGMRPNGSFSTPAQPSLPYLQHSPPTDTRLRSTSTSPLPPPTASSSKDFQIPPSVEVRPLELFEYLKTTKAETGQGPRVLLLDVRSRDEFEAGRIRGETVCLEPIILRDG